MITPRALVFDLDGTLIDSRGDIAAACNFALDVNGFAKLSTEEICRYIGDGAKTLCARAAKLPEADKRVDEITSAFVAYYTEHPIVHTKWMPGAQKMLDQLAPMPMSVCTNKARSTTDAVLTALGVRTRFSAIIAGGDIPEKKPAPGPIFAIAKLLGRQAEELVVIGDGDQDVLSGRRAGSRTIGVANGFCAHDRLAAAKPDVLVENLGEVAQIISRWAESTTRWG
jgi:phosphoglycolate phosphatase